MCRIGHYTPFSTILTYFYTPKMKLFCAALLVACSFSVACACSCLPTSLQQAFTAPETSSLIKGRIESNIPTGSGQGDSRFYLIRTLEVYKGCNVPPLVFAKSKVAGNLCGINLARGTSYIVPLSSDLVQSLNLCQFIREFDSLPPADMQFLVDNNQC
eukprot:TRINITY_DN8713_c0_g1_i1.p1 TRINITY_DN8713_c0_g1~~TRINITY_DN8713_c0_g1_i1.p1  ORF type:complete len:158 (+),score=10.81 TRINITY_DN8713_c0_g1_i1:100-573(+)